MHPSQHPLRVMALSLLPAIGLLGFARAQTTRPAAGELDLSPYELAVVYETEFDQPLNVLHEDALVHNDRYEREVPDDVDWVLEGPGRATVQDGRLLLENGTEGKKPYHVVLWNSQPFPENFLLEFGFIPHDSNLGLAIVFFCATARDGKTVHAPGLRRRGGLFKRYHSGDLNSYHVSYFAIEPTGDSRGTSNLRKNHGFHLVAQGPDHVGGTQRPVHTIRLLKVGGRIQVETNGKICISWEDDGTTGGPALGKGQVGLRQMKHCESGQYTFFRVSQVTAK